MCFSGLNDEPEHQQVKSDAPFDLFQLPEPECDQLQLDNNVRLRGIANNS